MSALSERLGPADRGTPEKKARASARRAGVFLVVAVTAAAGAGVLFNNYLERRSMSVQAPTVQVVVAAMDLPAASSLRTEHLTTVPWPAANVLPGTVRDPASVAGRVVVTALVKGEPLLAGKLAAENAGRGLAAVLPESMRAVSVRVDDVVGVAGFIHPGDSVDVIVTMKPEERSDAPSTSKVILQKIKVLAVGKELERKPQNLEKPVSATVATLMVTPEQSEKLALAAARGQLLLTLRGGMDVEEVETPGIIAAVLLEDAPTAAKKVSTPPPTRVIRRVRTKVPEPTTSPVHQVEIFRGDTFEKRDFKQEVKQ